MVRHIIYCLVVFTLMFHQGCAHTGPIFSDSTQEEIGRIGVLIKTVEMEEQLQDSHPDWLSSMGKGAQKGSLAGGAGLLCGPIGAVICIPALAAAGIAGGSMYGLYQASSETLPTETESILKKALLDTNLAKLFEKNLVKYAQENGYEMGPVISSSTSFSRQTAQETLSVLQPFDTILEINGPVVNLLPSNDSLNPPRKVGLSVHLRFIRTADQVVLDDRIILEDLGNTRILDTWVANNAHHFREDLPRASRRLSEKLIIEYFMRHGFEERTYHLRAPGVTGLFPFLEYRVKGLRSPKIRERRDLIPERAVQEAHSPTRVKSLRPTLHWEAFSGEQVTYDLIIWEPKMSRAEVGEVIYKRVGIPQNVHTLETSLKSSSTYTWSVRARFLQDGKGRVTEWSQYKIGFTSFGKSITLGTMALMESTIGDEWGFYQIQTP